MAQIIFTQQLARFLPVPTLETRAATLRAALDEAFAANPRLGAYVLDEQGRLRANVVVFIDGKRSELNEPLRSDSKIYVLQALSGG
ncbi:MULTISPECIES: MoaD/ThiS family protein [unclassified Duganella]|uniref:MoaD/ThiS family protein n=1 Tax=unclassified Duganella TaxID=2636909 RepID=UPI0006FEA03F|nr:MULTISPECIES: MoaD/ThiS family protein [unclassified Duganella]KQV59001.1 thiamine biosynthesis protein ThiS [Duganella sp. Root336D2]KRC02503.1 thiamine biosynthesis protein ThiS [Duganella sp. Root198D2]